MPKRKRSSIAAVEAVTASPAALPTNAAAAAVASDMAPSVPLRRASTRKAAQPSRVSVDANPDTNTSVKDGSDALRASPDAAENEKQASKSKAGRGRAKKVETSPTPISKSEPDAEVSPLSELSDLQLQPPPRKALESKTTEAKRSDAMDAPDPEAEGDEVANPEEVQEALSRPPPVNSSYLPLPWKGRLGYCCLNTYLRAANPPVFSSRTCRIASILEHRHPLKDPSQPEHPTKNRPDKDQPADVARGQAYVESLGLANARDIVKMLRWNDRYGIKFFRLSSEMFPFASHDVYGYKLAPFAAEVLAEAGRVAAELGHRLTTHPGQFTQLGSPRKEVITASIRDLEYHCELLDLLKLPAQQDRDAVMILHMGGIFGDKEATIARFKENYQRLSPQIKKRLVLENDDMCYSVHDLLPVCQELNIPLVLDFHHHNIVFDADKIREGTLDIVNLYDRIKATWTRKNITQKMHYSEPTPGALTARHRRKHNPRVTTLPPCAPDMDLMIEAKDKEQAVFELMRIFKLPGFESFNDITPYVRGDENRPWKPPRKKKTPKKRKGEEADEEEEPEPQPPPTVPGEEVSMGGTEGRVYWPPGMEEWLRPKKREVKPRDPEKIKSTAEKAAERRALKAEWQAAREASAEREREMTGSVSVSEMARGETAKVEIEKTKSVYDKAKASKAKPARAPKSTKKTAKSVLTPSTSESDEQGDEDVPMPDLTDTEAPRAVMGKPGKSASNSRRQSGRGAKRKAVNYAEVDEEA